MNIENEINSLFDRIRNSENEQVKNGYKLDIIKNQNVMFKTKIDKIEIHISTLIKALSGEIGKPEDGFIMKTLQRLKNLEDTSQKIKASKKSITGLIYSIIGGCMVGIIQFILTIFKT